LKFHDNHIVVFLVFLLLSGAFFGFILDDPDHFLKPDPDCPFCVFLNLFIVATASIPILNLLYIFAYSPGISSFFLPVKRFSLNLLIRAPPNYLPES